MLRLVTKHAVSRSSSQSRIQIPAAITHLSTVNIRGHNPRFRINHYAGRPFTTTRQGQDIMPPRPSIDERIVQQYNRLKADRFSNAKADAPPGPPKSNGPNTNETNWLLGVGIITTLGIASAIYKLSYHDPSRQKAMMEHTHTTVTNSESRILAELRAMEGRLEARMEPQCFKLVRMYLCQDMASPRAEGGRIVGPTDPEEDQERDSGMEGRVEPQVYK